MKRRHKNNRRHAITLRRALLYVLGTLLAAVAVANGDEYPRAPRLADIAFIPGDPILITGIGLVTGLEGTGDGCVLRHTDSSLVASYRRLGLLTDGIDVAPGSTAAVLVTMTVDPNPALCRVVKVIALGDALSILGGNLRPINLQSTDGRIRDCISGPIEAGVVAAAAGPAAGVVQAESHAREPVFFTRIPSGHMTVELRHHGQSVSASRVARLINQRFGHIAEVGSESVIRLNFPEACNDAATLTGLAVELGQLPLHALPTDYWATRPSVDAAAGAVSSPRAEE